MGAAFSTARQASTVRNLIFDARIGPIAEPGNV